MFEGPISTMVHGCGNRTLKFLFFTANLLICLFGAFIFGLSLWGNLDKDFTVKLQEAREIHKEDINILAKYQASLWTLVVVGAFLFLVGFLGCCGTIYESTILLTFRLLSATGSSEDKYSKILKPIEDLFQCCGATQETKNLYVEQKSCQRELQNMWKNQLISWLRCYTANCPSSRTILIYVYQFRDLDSGERSSGRLEDELLGALIPGHCGRPRSSLLHRPAGYIHRRNSAESETLNPLLLVY
uniref:Tetraspanin n=1 Tax=Setaria digitata TaxID=48799 RepID=A0A915PN89_9BILA